MEIVKTGSGSDIIALKPGDSIRVKNDYGDIIEIFHGFDGIRVVNLSDNGCMHGKRGKRNDVIFSNAQPKSFWKEYDVIDQDWSRLKPIE